MRIRKEADQVYVKDEIIDYIVRLCDITRNDGRIIQGASPRASLALTALSRPLPGFRAGIMFCRRIFVLFSPTASSTV